MSDLCVVVFGWGYCLRLSVSSVGAFSDEDVIAVLRRVAILLCLVMAWFALVYVAPAAKAEPGGLLDETAAMAQARKTGAPVIVSAKTDETTLITADPSTGLFTAELSARPARVRDGSGGWREPSSRLIQTADGSWQTEAGVVQVRVSNGGAPGNVATLADGTTTAGLSWPEALPTPVVDGSTATYGEVWPGVDLVVRADVDAVESFLVVKTPQAGLNPKVRDWSMPISTPGLTANSLGNGGKSFVDSQGVQRMMVPAAMMWDSKGKPSGLQRAEDRVDPGLQSKAAPVAVKVASGKLTASSDRSFLDDPDTVYPVVIDPVLQLASELNHVLRVTDDWSKWDSAVGSQGKIGYNGWTSPYYRSRMFYQIKWPAVLAPEQISSATFRYVQTHSPQHSPCKSSSTSYPTERAKLATTITSSDTWSDRTEAGGGWHPQPSVLPVTRMAVGHEDYCKTAALEEWNLTSAIRTERANYSTRTTVTIGIYSDAESNKMGWKYYDNHYGTSPQLRLTYQLAPNKPQPVGVVERLASGNVYSPTPTLQATLTLPNNDLCYGQACLKADFTIKEGTTVLAVVSSQPVAAGGTATVQAPTLQNGHTYTFTVRSYSTDVAASPPFYSPESDQVGFTTSFAPAAPTGLALWNSNGASASGTPPVVSTSQPYLSAKLPGAQVCPSGPCLKATFELLSPSQSVVYSVDSDVDSPEQPVTVRVNSATALAGTGNYLMRVSVLNVNTGQRSSASSLQFTRQDEPSAPILSGLTLSHTQFSVHVDNPVPGTVYTWTTQFTPDGSSDSTEVRVADLAVDSYGTLTVPWDWSGSGDFAVTVGCTVGDVPCPDVALDSEYLW